jgi:hypothetical protein
MTRSQSQECCRSAIKSPMMCMRSNADGRYPTLSARRRGDDRARNKHRLGIAWNKFAVRAILTNPRYTGCQVWNKQRKDEMLLDVKDVDERDPGQA